jgi:hypothetical protein
MIITSTKPFSPSQTIQLKEQFDIYIKTVIDIDQKICVAGMDRHFEGEQILLKQGSKQSNIWGGGIDLETKEIDFNSFIYIRPLDNNPKNDILDPKIRDKYQKITEFFFAEVL